MKNIAIRENHLYSKTYAKGKRFSGRFLSVYILRDYAAERLKKANPQKQYVNRIGLSVSKKIGTAVKRNRAKRVLRAALFCAEQTEPLQKGWLIVISPKTSIIEPQVRSQDVARELRYAFRKLGIAAPKTAPASEPTKEL